MNQQIRHTNGQAGTSQVQSFLYDINVVGKTPILTYIVPLTRKSSQMWNSVWPFLVSDPEITVAEHRKAGQGSLHFTHPLKPLEN